MKAIASTRGESHNGSAEERIRSRLLRCYKIFLTGTVQGVGFRPFVYRLAKEMGLPGWVGNSAQGATIELECGPETLRCFIRRLQTEKPPRCRIQSLECSETDAVGSAQFLIRESDISGRKEALVLPDIATCQDCLREIFDPANRRYRYPFTNCTHCGPRFSIIESLPYDRSNTTMKKFLMCESCRAEYENPSDRRFHAQPNACPQCGPNLEFWNQDGKKIIGGDDALRAAEEAIRRGKILAVKGLGGFHLMADAWNESAVGRLRERKRREEKPFALMFPSIEKVRLLCEVSDIEAGLLTSPESPIVLLRQSAPRSSSIIACNVAPSNPYLGVMLPYTPLHHLLMGDLNFPVVATSGNLRDEPICTDENEALDRLRGVADCFLVHDRPIIRHVDDSIVRIMAGRPMILRRARGYAPLPLTLPQDADSVLAVGAHLKNTVAVSIGKQVFVSQHIGDLETVQAADAFQKTIASFKQLYEVSPRQTICDVHPDYFSTQSVRRENPFSVQHHYAHVLSCMADNGLDENVLGVAWDGTGLGTDGTIWGGEFLLVSASSFSRAGHFRTFRLPGGEKAVREPRRSALGLLYEIFGNEVFEMKDLPVIGTFKKEGLKIFKSILNQGIQSPVTSSAGRLFDAVSALVGIRQVSSFEGQAAMELEFVQDGIKTDETYPLEMALGNSAAMVIDWEPMARTMLHDLEAGVTAGIISAKFHRTLAEAIVSMAIHAGEKKVVLSGGCFQNKTLCESAIQRLREEGFEPYWHRNIPTNDGGISVGQVMAVARLGKEKQKCA